MIRTINCEGLPVWAYVINDIEISDPFVSECGRFDVTPDYYGLTLVQANDLREANK
jgi:hypothetical protein